MPGLLILGAFIIYVAIAWQLLRRGQRLATVGLLVCTALIVGYGSYRGICTQPMSCDVGGTNPHFLNGTPHYFERIVPFFAITSGLGFAAATAVMYRRTMVTTAVASTPATIALTIVVGIVTFFMAIGVAAMIRR